MNRHSALLLAAGGSTRLGRPKQLLTVNGVPLVRHIAELLLETGPERLVVVTGGPATETGQALAGLDSVLVQNDDWKTGMASSLQCGYRAFGTDPGLLLITGTDQPCLTCEHLRALLRQGNNHTDVVTAYGEEGRGIPVLLSPTTQLRLADLRGDTGLRRLWKNGASTPAFLHAPELGFDIDTPEQLEAAIRAGWIDRD
ncbi:nucleotidyltransferase family protein [Gluconobacter sp. Dm-73]|uniref:nucleotidyltransferase family protein n=1 Tax=Gluconobacter sp. Dm-73 TaxID=2799802 RepID=UPI001B8B121B|nr:nucleotidyltransferase family protein [Gluconobacter sp. Dm-73]MBS1074310.1 nucleotidyltransferase family protein [Gluconobacter sp. Dm-73]